MCTINTHIHFFARRQQSRLTSQCHIVTCLQTWDYARYLWCTKRVNWSQYAIPENIKGNSSKLLGSAQPPRTITISLNMWAWAMWRHWLWKIAWLYHGLALGFTTCKLGWAYGTYAKLPCWSCTRLQVHPPPCWLSTKTPPYAVDGEMDMLFTAQQQECPPQAVGLQVLQSRLAWPHADHDALKQHLLPVMQFAQHWQGTQLLISFYCDRILIRQQIYSQNQDF